MAVKFGTDGWRDVIAEDFTYENVKLVANAHAQYLVDIGATSVVVGFDTRFQGKAFARIVAEVMADWGLTVWLADEYLPTPALSFAVLKYQAGGGVMITASHNPPQYSGYKIKANYGGSATPDIIQHIEMALWNPRYKNDNIIRRGEIKILEIRQDYYRQLDKQLNLELLRSYKGKVFHDAMGGAACGWLTGYAKHAGLQFDLQEIHGSPDPMFYGVNPEPIPKNLQALIHLLKDQSGLTFGVVTDGDADRVGVITAEGHFFNSHKIFAVLIQHLYNRGLHGCVVKTVSGSYIIELLSKNLGLDILETPVGFKYITNAFLDEKSANGLSVMIGGEESGGFASKGHIPERDGLLNSLLLVEAVASNKKGLEEIFSDIELLTEFHHFYDRADLKLDKHFNNIGFLDSFKGLENFMDITIDEIKTLDGVKLLLDSKSSVMFRASGTEPVVRVYVEAQTKLLVDSLLKYAVEYVKLFVSHSTYGENNV